MSSDTVSSDTVVGVVSVRPRSTGDLDGPLIRPYVVMHHDDLFLVCVSSIAEVDQVVRERSRLRRVRFDGDFRVAALPMSRLLAEDAALCLGDMVKSLSYRTSSG